MIIGERLELMPLLGWKRCWPVPDLESCMPLKPPELSDDGRDLGLAIKACTMGRQATLTSSCLGLDLDFQQGCQLQKVSAKSGHAASKTRESSSNLFRLTLVGGHLGLFLGLEKRSGFRQGVLETAMPSGCQQSVQDAIFQEGHIPSDSVAD